MKPIEEQIMETMNTINYGWVDKNNNAHNEVDENFSDNYILQSPKELLENKLGVCWDQVELERYLFEKNNINITTYFIVHYDGADCPTHTFLVFKNNNMYYWFEHSWEIFRGIHKYQTLKELLNDVRNKFIKTELKNNYEKENLVLHEYNKPKYHLSVQEFFNHCDSGKFIDIDKL